MRKSLWLAVLAALVLTMSACSARTKAFLEEERQNGAHFATWSHLGYSLFRDTPEATTKQDVELSQKDVCLPNQTCKWWGEAIAVRPIQ